MGFNWIPSFFIVIVKFFFFYRDDLSLTDVIVKAHIVDDMQFW